MILEKPGFKNVALIIKQFCVQQESRSGQKILTVLSGSKWIYYICCQILIPSEAPHVASVCCQELKLSQNYRFKLKFGRRYSGPGSTPFEVFLPCLISRNLSGTSVTCWAGEPAGRKRPAPLLPWSESCTSRPCPAAALAAGSPPATSIPFLSHCNLVVKLLRRLDVP